MKNSRPRGADRHRLSLPAFTLVELLITIAILAVLIAIGIPAYSRQQELARATACAANLRSLGVGLSLYLGENNSTFPTLEIGRASLDDDVPVIDTALLEYVDSADVFRCPSDRKNFFETTGTSYFWNNLLNGQRASNTNFLGLVRSPKGIPAISDKENFHKSRGHEVNILYIDGHVDKELQFNVDL
jgi:prepilin-type N-terminal cleavage/methylation domain-containing protein/prepilin-type processing-associated H-X9-DG protein